MGVASGLSRELTKALQKARSAWLQEPLTGTKYVYFEDKVQDHYGVQLHAQLGIGYTGYTVVDEEKFSMFILKWS